MMLKSFQIPFSLCRVLFLCIFSEPMKIHPKSSTRKNQGAPSVVSVSPRIEANLGITTKPMVEIHQVKWLAWKSPAFQEVSSNTAQVLLFLWPSLIYHNHQLHFTTCITESSATIHEDHWIHWGMVGRRVRIVLHHLTNRNIHHCQNHPNHSYNGSKQRW